MRFCISILLLATWASLATADDLVEVSGMKVKRLGYRGGAEQQVSIGESHSEERFSEKRSQAPAIREIAPSPSIEHSSHFLGESLVLPKRRPFTDW